MDCADKPVSFLTQTIWGQVRPLNLLHSAGIGEMPCPNLWCLWAISDSNILVPKGRSHLFLPRCWRDSWSPSCSIFELSLQLLKSLDSLNDNWGQPDGSADKAFSGQTWWPEFNPQDPCKVLTTKLCCDLHIHYSIWIPIYIDTRTHTHILTQAHVRTPQF